MSTFEDLRLIRLEKARKLREMGIDPYPATSKKDFPNGEIVDHFDQFEGKIVSLTGRLMSYREHGAIAFGNLQDQSGTIQLFIKKDVLSSTSSEHQRIGFSDLNLVDIGDFLQVSGEVTKTSTGQISLLVAELKMLTKAIRSLPDKHEGLKDPELIFRRRYLDFVTSPEHREVFIRKSSFWRKAREFMISRGFMEVETPILEPVTGGADARPFVTHHNSLGQDFYLRISSELYQKRIIGGGFEKIFVLGPNFRNEGIDDEHLQEFYQLEYYWAYSDIKDTIALTKDIYKYLAQEVWGRTKFTKGQYTFDLADEWQVIDYIKIIKERFDVDVFETSLERIYEIIKENGIRIEFEQNRNRLVDNLWKIIRKDIAGPAALINAPKFISPLAKSYFQTPQITQRFQPIIAGSEVGNAYSELNDPVDQLNRFLDQQKMRDSGDQEAQMLDIDFVEMLEYGMPPTSCIGFSERLFWFLEGVTAREGTFFPQMRHMVTDETKKLYGLSDEQLGLKSNGKTQSIATPTRYIHKPFYFSIDPQVLAAFPTVSVGIALIQNATIIHSSDALEQDKARIVKEMKVTLEQIDTFKEIDSYRRLYKEMGVDLKKRRPSPEALLRRVAQGKELYTVNTCVDAYNVSVMRHRVSLGAFDADKIEFPTKLQFAWEGDEILLLGDTEPTKFSTKELAYYDKLGGYNLDLNYRDAQRTMVTEQTKNIWVNAEGVFDISPKQVEEALREAVTRILEYCGGDVVFEGMVKV